MSLNKNATDGVLTRTERFVLEHFFSSYPKDMTFAAILEAYEDPNNSQVVATDFWTESLWPANLVEWVRGMEAALRFEFFTETPST
ncbi:hypothetical protein [Hydromonas duriensis]|uniref:Uncharacterized protein n=1 Tax=Hydromonas duriensis TaxID=1527608 RepID=A0A4R6Y4X0_9BURK|nr:hypothetical protein [Hydromonas duriensis]TDR28937.1 hypothetical protein DFR44_1306 [Hydromonas duriensis]